MRDKILSIQSKLIYGYVGSNVAELVIQLRGLDTISFPTVYLATHTGHQPVYGKAIEKELFEQYILGVKALNILPQVANIITGYIGSDEILDVAAEFVRELRESYPDRPYICDPVMGDVGGLYVDESTAQKMVNSLIPLADIITPNHFELEYILGVKVDTVAEIVERVNSAPVLEGKTVIVTSCRLKDVDDDQIEILLLKNGGVERIPCKTIDIETIGTGDFFTALLSSQLAMGVDILPAVINASQTISKALQYTVDNGNAEMTAASILHALGKL